MSQQQEEVEMKTINKDEVENEEDSGSEYTGSEYTEALLYLSKTTLYEAGPRHRTRNL